MGQEPSDVENFRVSNCERPCRPRVSQFTPKFCQPGWWRLPPNSLQQSCDFLSLKDGASPSKFIPRGLLLSGSLYMVPTDCRRSSRQKFSGSTKRRKQKAVCLRQPPQLSGVIGHTGFLLRRCRIFLLKEPRKVPETSGRGSFNPDFHFKIIRSMLSYFQSCWAINAV